MSEMGNVSRTAVLICSLLEKFELKEQLAILTGLCEALNEAIDAEKKG